MSDASVVVLVADGLRTDTLRAAIDAGTVPALAALREEGGLGELTTTFPSVTGMAYVPLLTGWHPGPAGVPGLRWYDRSRRLPVVLGHARSYLGPQLRRFDHDLDPGARTLFELVPDRSLGSLAMVTRGLPPAAQLDRGWRVAAAAVHAHVTGNVSAWAALEERLAERLLARVRSERPRFVFAAFTAGDKASHVAGVSSPGVVGSLRVIDDMVARLRRDAEARGRWHETDILVVSDHGHSPVTRHVELADELRSLGVRTRAHPWTIPDGAEAAVMVSGNSMAHVYVDLEGRERRPWPALTPWRSRLAPLWSHPAVDLISTMTSSTSVEVWREGRSASIHTSGTRFTYRHGDGDPLGIDAFEGACATEVHERCAGSAYPDGVFQLARLVLAPRSGDLVLSARHGFDLRAAYEPVDHVSSHGALHSAHMLVPLLRNRRPAGTPRRTADLFHELMVALAT